MQTMSPEARSDQERFEIITDSIPCQIMLCTAREREKRHLAQRGPDFAAALDFGSRAARVGPRVDSHVVC